MPFFEAGGPIPMEAQNTLAPGPSKPNRRGNEQRGRPGALITMLRPKGRPPKTDAALGDRVRLHDETLGLPTFPYPTL
jgi:hypothetical protein